MGWAMNLFQPYSRASERDGRGISSSGGSFDEAAGCSYSCFLRYLFADVLGLRR